MKQKKQNKYNKCLLKALFLLTATLLLLFYPRSVTYASVISTTDNQTIQMDTLADLNTDNTAANAVINIDGNTEDITAEDTTAEDTSTGEQELLQGEGYYLDEQGQVYYDDTKRTVEEPIIEAAGAKEIKDKVITEDTENTSEEAKEVNNVSKDVKKDNSKVKKAQTKEVNKSIVKKPTYSKAELRILSCLVYAEAGNQSYKGMLGVANVVINRAKSDVYWHVDTIKEVVYDRKWSVQFSVTMKSSKTGLSALDKALKSYDTGKFTGPNPTAQKKAMDRAIKAAKDALEGKNNIGGYLCFTNKREASSIKKRYTDYEIIGDHIFYRTK